MDGTKVCTKCKEEKTFDKFTSHKYTRDGLASWCKSCTVKIGKEDRKRWAEDNRDRHLEIERKAQKVYNKKNPDKIKAHDIANARRSELISERCTECGETEKLQMHHPDYAKPLEVIILCASCHRKVHVNV